MMGEGNGSGDPLKVCFFGDSICAGQYVNPHKGWVPQLSASLSNLNNGGDRRVLLTNASVNGDTTRLALERMPSDVQKYGLDLLVVQFGMNDCNFWETDRGVPRVSPKAFVANLEEIIDRAFTFGARWCFINTNHPTLRNRGTLAHTDSTYEQQNRKYNEIIRRVAPSRSRLSLIDIEKSVLDRTRGDDHALARYLLPDLLHLSEAGNDLYFEIVHEPLRKKIEELIGDDS